MHAILINVILTHRRGGPLLKNVTCESFTNFVIKLATEGTSLHLARDKINI